MSDKYPYKPPSDAKEWTCPICGCDVLWCGCSPSSDRIPEPLGRKLKQPKFSTSTRFWENP